MSTFNISKISVVFEKYEFSFVYFEIVYPGNRKGGYPPSLLFGRNKGRVCRPCVETELTATGKSATDGN